MHDGVQYDPFKVKVKVRSQVGNSAIFKGYLLRNL